MVGVAKYWDTNAEKILLLRVIGLTLVIATIDPYNGSRYNIIHDKVFQKHWNRRCFRWFSD